MNVRGTLRRAGAATLGAVAAVGLTGLAAGGTASAGTVQQANISITYHLPAAVGQSAADALDPELFVSGSDISDGGMCTEDANATSAPSEFTKQLDCTVLPGEEHVIGVSMLPPDHYVAFVSCFTPPILTEAIDLPEASITPAPFTNTVCDVYIEPFPTLYIDKVVIGDGPLDSTDFTLEVYGDTGALVDGTITDPSTDTCTLADLDDTKCAAIALTPGDYALGEVLPDYGYDLASASCASERPQERFPAPVGEFTHGEFGADTHCTITNEYLTQPVTADLVVVNDDGGTATGADFIIEVFDNTGTKVDDGPDPEPGTGNASAEFVLPIGDYTFGVSGPAGYTSSAVVTPVDVSVELEIIETGADFSLTRTQTAAGTITVDDPPVATTTTTTTTTLPATTTTTTIATTLPATGGDSQLPMMLLALAFIGLGGAAIVTTRRS